MLNGYNFLCQKRTLKTRKMKTIKNSLGALALIAILTCSSCGKKSDGTNTSGSESQSTPNDSSGAESTKPMGVAEDNQNEVSGYPSNQSNLHPDSTKGHDVDTTKLK